MTFSLIFNPLLVHANITENNQPDIYVIIVERLMRRVQWFVVNGVGSTTLKSARYTSAVWEKKLSYDALWMAIVLQSRRNLTG